MQLDMVRRKAQKSGLADLIRMMAKFEASEMDDHEDSNEQQEEVLDAMHESLEPDGGDLDAGDDDPELSPEDDEFEAEKREFMKRSNKNPAQKGKGANFMAPASAPKKAPAKKGA